jgi:hypothetical protein
VLVSQRVNVCSRRRNRLHNLLSLQAARAQPPPHMGAFKAGASPPTVIRPTHKHTMRCVNGMGCANVHTHNERQPTHSTHHLRRKNLWPPSAWEQNPAQPHSGWVFAVSVSCVPKMSRHPAKRENLGPLAAGPRASCLKTSTNHQATRQPAVVAQVVNQEVDPHVSSAEHRATPVTPWEVRHMWPPSQVGGADTSGAARPWTPGTQPHQQQQPPQNRGAHGRLNRPVTGFMNGSHAAHMQAVSPLTHTDTYTDTHGHACNTAL